MSTASPVWWRPRRLIVLGATIALVAIVSLVAMLATGQATSGGDPYSAPDVADTNPDPNIVETTLVAETASVDIGNGVTANAQTFNGSLPGPTFHLKVGDEVIVHFENQLDRPSGIHWHGIELSNEMDGTPFTQDQVVPGGTFLYKFKVTRPGLYWYHPHHHSSTNQVFKGLYGMIVVTDPNDAALQASGTLPPQSQTKPIVLSDATVCKQRGSNDNATYSPTLPHVSGAALPAQPPPVPRTLCETPTAVDEEGAPRPSSFAAGDIPNIQLASTAGPPPSGSGRTNEGQTLLTNGKNVGGRAAVQGIPPTSRITPGALSVNASKLDVQSGQGLRLQIVNAAAIRYMRLRLTTATGTPVPLVRVGGEGGLLDNAVIEGGLQGAFDTAYNTGEILLPPGSRADVVAAIPTGLPVNSVMTLWTEDYLRTGGGYSNIPTVPVMHLNVTGPAAATYTIAAGTPLRAATGNRVTRIDAPTSTLLNPAVFTPAKLGMLFQNIQLTADTVAPNSLGVDNVFGTHDVRGSYSDAAHLRSTRYAREGDTLELTVQNTTGARHPFHLHGFSIQPINLTKAANPTYTWAYPEYRDNVDIPAGYTLRFRIRLDPRPLPDDTTPGGALGRWVFHCHIFFHATNGMLGELVVLPAGPLPASNGNERPDINVSGTSVRVNQGQTATIRGTYADRDGNPVTLTASKGTVADNGGGNWTWTFPTGNADSGFIYVTATDSGGLKGQMPFFLKIDNTAPTITVPGPQTVAAGSPLSFGVSAADPDATDTIALSASGLPSGPTFKDNGNRTGSVSGAVTAAPGQYVATFSASDGKNAAATAAVPIKVTAAKFALTAVVDRPERLVKKSITVGCLTSLTSLRTCRAEVLVGKKVVGKASKSLTKTGKRSMSVRVKLDRATQRRVARSIGGQKVRVRVTATRFESPSSLTASASTTVVAPSVVVSPRAASFGRNSATLTTAARTYLTKLAKTVRKANRIVCGARPDSGLSRARSLQLAKSRATAACAALRSGKLKAKFTTSAGRALPGSQSRNRRIRITILR